MSETKFTPGPWEVSRQGSFLNVFRIETKSPITANHAMSSSEPNRNLIAAAPEMLGTLDNVLSVLLDLDQDHLSRREEKMVCDAIQEIEAVLAKARGES